MALQAPSHRVSLIVVNDIHFRNIPVATDARDATIDVHGVVKIDVVWSLVDLDPLDRFPGLPRVAHRLQLGVLRLNLRMAVHTGLSRRHV